MFALVAPCCGKGALSLTKKDYLLFIAGPKRPQADDQTPI